MSSILNTDRDGLYALVIKEGSERRPYSLELLEEGFRGGFIWEGGG